VKNGKINHKASLSSSNVEQIIEHKSMGAKKTARFNGPVSILINSRRKRLCDEAGISEKYVIDSLVDCGILLDDSPAQVRSIDHVQETTKGPEETIITITEV
jgi:hypothetical protein